MSEEIKQLNNVVLTGTGLGGEGVSDKTGKAWKKMDFHFDVEGRSRKFGGFLPIPFPQSLQPEQIVMGTAYDIKFKEEPYVLTKGQDVGKQVMVKNLLGIYTAGTLPQLPQQTYTAPVQALPQPVQLVGTEPAQMSTQTPHTAPNLALPSQNIPQTPVWDDVAFATAYRDNPAVNVVDKTIYNFIGNYIVSHPSHQQLFGVLKQLYDTQVQPK